MLTAKIETKNEIYHIEPSWRHLQGKSKTSRWELDKDNLLLTY